MSKNIEVLAKYFKKLSKWLYPALLGQVSPAAAAPAAEEAAAEEKAAAGTEAGWRGGGETEQP